MDICTKTEMTNFHSLSWSEFFKFAFRPTNKNESKSLQGYLVLRARKSLDTSPWGGWGGESPGHVPALPRGIFLLKARTSLPPAHQQV